MNGTTGRCSNCHMNVKPGRVVHRETTAPFTATSGRTDCSSCHSWPGTAARRRPNWLGAGRRAAVHLRRRLHDPAAARGDTTTTQAGINNLPHPTVGRRRAPPATQDGGGRKAIGYDHISTLDNANCDACHEAGSDLVSPTWNGATSQSGGAGDTRPFTITSLVAKKGGAAAR